ncbi:MAG: tetraacyldisaccharide 4'-kinase [Thermodesulfobacteriota bacterium]
MPARLRFLFAIGWLFSPLYGLAMRLRAWMYRHGVLLKQEKLPLPVVSIGNLTLGGTGKTPLVMYVTRQLLALGRKPAILSRGYGGKAKGPVNVVSDGSTIGLSASEAGDEPLLLAESLPGVPVLVGPKRATLGRAALDRFPVDTLILDDGFQHLAVARDFDLVLFSARTLLGNGRVFPGGPLREPMAALRRVHGFVITGVDKESRAGAEAFKQRLAGLFPEKPVFMGEYLPVCLLHSQQSKTFAIDKARHMPLYGFAGIANPDSFRRTLERERFLLTGFIGFPDHHRYTAADVESLIAAARSRKAAALVTTEKDYVKLAPLFKEFPLLALRVELFMEEEFDLFLAARMARQRSP